MSEVPPKSTWPAWRAGLITVVIVVQVMLALPLPRVVGRGEFETPTAREEVRRWTERLTGLGLDVTEADVQEWVLSITGAIGGTHRALKRPFRPLGTLTGTGQGWALFANPNLRPHRFEVSVAKTGDFELRYRQLDPEHRWWRTTLRYRRVRGCWDTYIGRNPRPVQRRFTNWLAERIFEAEPEVTAVRTRLVRTRSPLPGRPRKEVAEPRQVMVIEREANP